jgi:hypothetical protein
MAANWIKIEHSMPDKPEVDGIAVHLGLDHDAVVGKLLRFWIWADQQTIDGKSFNVTDSFLDRLTNCPGFAAALVQVGWLARRNGRLSLPNFDRHNGQTAKSRALSGDRMLRKRYGDSVTKAQPDQRRPEKTETREDSVKKPRDSEGSGVSKKRRSGDLDRTVLESLLLFEGWIDQERRLKHGLVKSDDDAQLALALRAKAVTDSKVTEPVGFVKSSLMLLRTDRAAAWSRVSGKHEDEAKDMKNELRNLAARIGGGVT